MELRIKDACLSDCIGVSSKIPQNTLSEYAFAGKSNVGKSSLINALCGRNNLARTSSTPGKTRTINYYKVRALRDDNTETGHLLVDLPGYGFTKAAPEAREQWGRMVERYLNNSCSLKKIFLLVDMRHAPGENDIMMYRWIREKGYTPVVIATKLDKLKKNEIPKALKLIRSTLSMDEQDTLIAFSAVTKAGVKEICDLTGKEN